MRRGVSYIEVIISITIISICFLPLLNMLYITIYNDNVSKELYMANLLSVNMLVEIESSIISEVKEEELLLRSSLKELTRNKNFEKEYKLDVYDYYVHIEKNQIYAYEYKTKNYINEKIVNTLVNTGEDFTIKDNGSYDIIINRSSDVDELVSNDEEFTRILIINDLDKPINLNFTTNNKVLIHILGKKVDVIGNINGTVIYTDNIYNNDYYIVSVLVYKGDTLRASNMKVFSR